MVVSPAFQRGERAQKKPVSPVEAVQNGEIVTKITVMRLHWVWGRLGRVSRMAPLTPMVCDAGI